MRLKMTSWFGTVALVFLSSCQVTYYLKSAYHQTKILNARIPIEKALIDPKIDEKTKHKLRLALEARKFSEKELGLTPSKNYTTYADLGRPYVSWIVHAAPAFELKHHLWKFPFVGELPYKGFFSEDEAKAEALTFSQQSYDTYVRGVTAYSTLGWFEDPILNTMIPYSDHHLVNLIIHETVHSTLYIKSQADFNEQLATFIGNLGTQSYYQQLEGENSPTLQIIEKESQDDELFSHFLTTETDLLSEWYQKNSPHITREEKQKRLDAIITKFNTQVQPLMKTTSYNYFGQQSLNNAQLLSIKTYFYDLTKFKKAFAKMNNDFHRFIEFCKTLEKDPDPGARLATLSN